MSLSFWNFILGLNSCEKDFWTFTIFCGAHTRRSVLCWFSFFFKNTLVEQSLIVFMTWECFIFCLQTDAKQCSVGWWKLSLWLQVLHYYPGQWNRLRCTILAAAIPLQLLRCSILTTGISLQLLQTYHPYSFFFTDASF